MLYPKYLNRIFSQGKFLLEIKTVEKVTKLILQKVGNPALDCTGGQNYNETSLILRSDFTTFITTHLQDSSIHLCFYYHCALLTVMQKCNARNTRA